MSIVWCYIAAFVGHKNAVVPKHVHAQESNKIRFTSTHNMIAVYTPLDMNRYTFTLVLYAHTATYYPFSNT